MKYLLLSTFCLLFMSSGFAVAVERENMALNHILAHTKDKQPDKAKAYLTSRSYDLYDRIYKHKLTFLIPSDVEATRNEVKDGFNYVQFIDPSSKSQQNIIMAFQNDASIEKLDLPETLRIGLGENWEASLDMIEQSYLFARQFYGEKQSAKIAKAFLKSRN